MGSLDAMAEARAQKGHIAEATAVTKSSVVFSLLELPKKNHTLYTYIQGRWKLPKAGRASSNSARRRRVLFCQIHNFACTY